MSKFDNLEKYLGFNQEKNCGGSGRLPLENIITISAREYCEMKEKQLSDYMPVGVHVQGTGDDANPAQQLARQAPPGTEVIVGYQSQMTAIEDELDSPRTTTRWQAHGTALVPRARMNKYVYSLPELPQMTRKMQLAVEAYADYFPINTRAVGK